MTPRDRATRVLMERCFRHPGREAASRCPGCKRYYCRECVNEHEGRVLCAECLEKLLAPQTTRLRTWPSIAAPLSVLGGLLIAWLFFAAVANVLLLFPDTFHDSQSSFEEGK